MITSIEIQRLRGIREGKLEGLTPLTVLVGPNGCGKSTVLDGLLIAGHPTTPEAVGRTATRRKGAAGAPRWLLWRAGRDGGGEIQARAGDGRLQRVALLPTYGDLGGDIGVGCIAGNGESQSRHTVLMTAQEDWTWDATLPVAPNPLGVSAIALVDLESEEQQPELFELYTRTRQLGLDYVRRVEQELSATFGVMELDILTEGRQPVLHCVYAEHSVPSALTGDGSRWLLRLSLELISTPDGLVLLEEPEIHQHPRSIGLTAQAIWAAVRRGVQVVLSTHSTELIDALLATVGDDALSDLSVYSLALIDGVLHSVRRDGAEAKFAREQIEKDLR